MSYQENILQAVDMVVSQRLNEMSFDKTIVCKVEDDTNASKSEYTVSYQAMTMVVYAANPEEEYKKGQDVYVTVPQGDFNLRKIIIGYVSPSEIPTYLYTNPMKYLVRLSDNLMKDKSLGETLETITLRDYSEEGNMPPIKYLCFAADFFTSGTIDYTKKYGIKITGEGALKEDKGLEEFEWTFDSTQFQGNPYVFNGLFRQEQLFDIERFSELNNLKIELFKEDNDFSVTVSNIELIYGYAEEDLTKDNIYDKIILYEENKKETYSSTNKTLSLKIQYIYKDENGETNIKQLDQEKINWFVYYVGAENLGVGRNWGKIENSSPSLMLNGTSFKLKLSNTDTIEINLPDPDMKSLQIKAQYNNLTSNDLVFLEENEKDLQIALAGSGIELVSEQLNFLYDGASNELLASEEDSGMITAKLTGAAVWLETMTITWKIPKKGSMFEKPYTTKSYNNKTYTIWTDQYLSGNGDELFNKIQIEDKVYYQYEDIDENYYIITRKVKHKTDPQQKFVVKKNYDISATNNIIKCEATYPNYGEVYDSISIGFDIKGTAGTEYTFKIEIANKYDEKPWVYVGDDNLENNQELKTIIATATFLDPTGKEVEEFDYDNYIRWNFASEYINRGKIDYSFFENYMIEVETPINPKNEMLYIWDNNEYRYILTSDTEPQNGITYYNVPKGKTFEFTLNTEAFVNNYSNYHGIIKAYFTKDYTVNKEGNKVKFEAFQPIPVSLLQGVNSIAGASTIVYDFQGGNPSYNNESYNIVFDEGIITSEDDIILINIHQSNNQIVDINTEDNSLSPQILMPSGEFPKASVEISVQKTNGNTLGQIIQPLLIIRNSYTSNLLNTWNKEDQIINENDNYILTQMVGAGTKNDQNQFSGVFMGAVGKETGDGITGLYGYQDGELRFKFTENGEAYIGTGSTNYLGFNFKDPYSNGGLTIRTRSLYVETVNNSDETIFYLNTMSTGNSPVLQFKNKFQFNADGTAIIGGWNLTANALTQIKNNETIAIFSGTGNQGEDYYEVGNSGLKNNWTIWTENFGVARDGSVYMEGEIIANKGDIAGWKIEPTQFTYTYDAPEGSTSYSARAFIQAPSSYSDKTAAFGVYVAKQSGTLVTDWGDGDKEVNKLFKVTYDGHLYAQSATIQGTLQAGSIIANGDKTNKMQIGSMYLRSISSTSGSICTTNDVDTPGNAHSKDYCYITFASDLLGLNAIQGNSNNDVNSSLRLWMIPKSQRGYLYGTWLCDSGTITGSDKNIKNSIENLPVQYSNLVYYLNPVRYKYNDGTSDRYHTGFITQEVENALSICNIDTQDFAALVGFDRGTENEVWGLRYSEFIALNTAAIQAQKKEIDELRQQLAEIKEKLQ